jgi:alpha-1,4-digalacturonate transport system permease protein
MAETSRSISGFLLRRSGCTRLDWSDGLSYAYLILGVLIMLGPVAWLALSSIKSPANITEFPPTVLPYDYQTITIAGRDKPLQLVDAIMPDGSVKRLAQVARIGLNVRLLDPEHPDQPLVSVPLNKVTPVRRVAPSWANYTDLFGPDSSVHLVKYGLNSVFIAAMATLITVIINSMAAFALSKYRFRGRTVALIAILATIMVPSTVLLVPVFMIDAALGLVNNLWGVILPTVATPTGVFLLRQYMLTIPDELIEAARMDHASEWRIFWRIIMPLSAPALAVVTIFSIIWRWNDFLLPLVVLSQESTFTLQLALNSFQGENVVQYNYLLAMTVLTALPVTLIFVFLQRYIATGIASTGIK